MKGIIARPISLFSFNSKMLPVFKRHDSSSGWKCGSSPVIIKDGRCQSKETKREEGVPGIKRVWTSLPCSPSVRCDRTPLERNGFKFMVP